MISAAVEIVTVSVLTSSLSIWCLDNLQSGTRYMADGLPCGGQQLLQKAIDYRLQPHILWAALKA
jgi:hypothetical protein